MMSFRRSLISALVLPLALLLLPSSAAQAAPRKEFNIAWTIYVGWMPWQFAEQSGIVKKWADKYGITLHVTQINDYVESINQYTAGKFDGVTVTNMDALTIPAASGVDTTALITGDYSDGNDGILLKGKDKLADIRGQKVKLVQFSVSHYLLARALASAGMSERDLTTVNASDADIVAIYGSRDTTAVVTWNPQLSVLRPQPDTHLVFDSSRIPGEIIDTLAVNAATLRDNPAFGKALVGIWFETLALLKDPGAAGKAARAEMAKASGATLASFEGQLKTTHLFYGPKEATAFVRDPRLVKTMDLVRGFCFDHALLGQNVRSKDAIGISFPGGKVLGNPANVKLHFDDSYMQQFADGKL